MGHRNLSHRGSLWCSEVCLEPSHVLLRFYSLARVQRKQALPKAQHLGKANNAVHWLLVRKSWETLLTFIYSDMFIMGYHSLYLRMGNLRHYPLHWGTIERKHCLTFVNFTLMSLTPDGILVKWRNEEKLSKISSIQTEKKKLEINHCKTFKTWISSVFLDFFLWDS